MMVTRSGEGVQEVVGSRSKQGVLPLLPRERKGDGGVRGGAWELVCRIEPRPGLSIGCYSQPARVVGRVGCMVSGQATSFPSCPFFRQRATVLLIYHTPANGRHVGVVEALLSTRKHRRGVIRCSTLRALLAGPYLPISQHPKTKRPWFPVRYPEVSSITRPTLGREISSLSVPTCSAPAPPCLGFCRANFQVLGPLAAGGGWCPLVPPSSLHGAQCCRGLCS
jgi:hypothetical protein